MNSLLKGRWALVTTATAVVLSTFGYSSAQVPQAQAPQGQAPQLSANVTKYGIAVVDISAIFKRHARFKATMESMKAEMETIEAELKADREAITKAEAHRNTFNLGQPEYKQADEKVAKMMADFQLKMGRLRKDFMEREAKIYYETYTEVVQMVNFYAKRHNIGLVLRFSGESIDPNRRDDVLREINKQVVMQDSIDITLEVLMLLNSRNLSTPQQPGASQAIRPTQPGTQGPR
ncbi:MAG TPA: OmpH family outer membrane protein [Lacipirellulaceae bacterium]|nr:OmpH family outer membrane protein [Lacipirellulaceae bacterium]